MFLVKTQAQVANDIVKYQALPPVLLQTGNKQSFAKKDSAAVNTHLYQAAANKMIGSLAQRFEIFTELSENEIYEITIAADVPDNKRPGKVYYKKKTGHVFVILAQKDTLAQTSVAQVFGFYPVRPVSSLFFRTVKGKIVNNGGRVHDASITQRLTGEQFEAVKEKALTLTAKKYNLNKYNCYNYAVEVFNSIPGVQDIPLLKVAFPFVFGRGGSPCALYKQLLAWQNTDSRIKVSVGNLQSPRSSTNQKIQKPDSSQLKKQK